MHHSIAHLYVGYRLFQGGIMVGLETEPSAYRTLEEERVETIVKMRWSIEEKLRRV